jgi:hypothetical protein
MPPVAKRKVQALVNLSLGYVERGPNGRDETSVRVARGEFVELTQKEIDNLGRYVRPVEEADLPHKRYTPKDLRGKPSGPAPSLEGTGAIDISEKTEEIDVGNLVLDD